MKYQFDKFFESPNLIATRQQQRRLLFVLIGFSLCIYLPGALFLGILTKRWTPSLVVLGAALITCLPAVLMLRRGHIRRASWWVIPLMWVFALTASYYLGGLKSYAFGAYVLMLILAGVYLGKRPLMVMTFMTILFNGWMWYLETTAQLPAPVVPLTPSLYFINISAILLLGILLIWMLLDTVIRTEKTALASQNRYHELFENAPIMYIVTHNTADGPIIMDCNRTFLEKTGYTLDEILQQPLARFFDKESQRALLNEGEYQLAMESESLIFERTLITKDGRTIETILHTRIEYGKNGQAVGTRATLEDISQLKATERALTRRSQELQVLRDANLALTYSLRLETVLDKLLEYLAQLIPYDTANVTLKNSRNQLYVASMRGHEQWTEPSEIRKIRFDLRHNKILKLMAQSKRSMVIPNTHLEQSWEQTPYTEYVRNWIGVPLVYEEELIGLFSLNKTKPNFFTEEHVRFAEAMAIQGAIAIQNARLHETLQHYATNLEQKVTQRTAELVEQTILLKTNNAELDNFAQTVAHDLKSPLSNLLGFSDLAVNRFDLYPNESKTYIEKVYKIGQQMVQMVDELLLMARLKRPDEIELTLLDMGTIVDNAMSRLEQMIVSLEAEIILPDKWPAALGYAPWVEEIWSNYLSNALKYGGRPPYIIIQAEHKETMIQFTVQDNGPGIPAEQQSQLFEPFIRLSNVNTQQTPGHGLGLSIVARIAKKLGGHTCVESKEGQGSTFGFTLQAAATETDRRS